MLEEVIKYVRESFEKRGLGKNVEHFERTMYWVKHLKPDADESILMAAYAHDIARAFNKSDSAEIFQNKEFDDPEILYEHQNLGAKIMTDFLEEKGYAKEEIKRVANMILKHEFGGDIESNLIKDADSISYFEVNAQRHAQKLSELLGKDKIKRKFYWMFNRLSSKNAKQIAEPYYDKAMNLLELK